MLTNEGKKKVEENSGYVLAKLTELTLKIEWYQYLINSCTGDASYWKWQIDLSVRERTEIRNYAQTYITGEKSLLKPSDEFPPFPFDNDLGNKMFQISKTINNIKEHSKVAKREPSLVQLILALETEEKFIAFYTAEWERSKEGMEAYTNLAYQFIEQLADRLYKK